MKLEYTIRQLKNQVQQSDFERVYLHLQLNSVSLTESDKLFLLKTAIIFLNYGDDSLRKLGYRIIVRYANLFKDYQPLYDTAIYSGYIPIAKFILSKKYIETNEDSFAQNYVGSFIEDFKIANDYFSYGQKILNSYSRNSTNNFVMVAPTSYGKSGILINRILEFGTGKVVIIVPSKALLAQTKKRLLATPEIVQRYKRIITHADMFMPGETNFLAVLTQERLLRLLQSNLGFSIDLLLLDEAHNLMKKDKRAILLAQVILILKKRNKNITLNFFTPFVSSESSLKIGKSDYTLQYVGTKETMKSERFYLWQHSDRKLFYYDQFLNKLESLPEKKYIDEMSIIRAKQAEKNIVYLNRPQDVEHFANKMRSELGIVENKIKDAIDAISDYLHPEYNLIKCLKHGVVYHHGGMPELIRLYVENAYSKLANISFIVTNSTLLEGVNIPAERMFLLTHSIGRGAFSKSEFKNLIGRICRLSEVFHPENGSLRMLEPEVYLLLGGYARSGANGLSFYERTVRSNVKIDDKVENVLVKNNLTADEKKEARSALLFLENIEPKTVDIDNVKYAKTDIGKSCFRNNIYDFDILLSENKLNANIASYDTIGSIDELMDAIYDIFLKNIEITNDDFGRLKNKSARSFYSMILNWKMGGSSYKQLIGKFTKYWKGLPDQIIYVGNKWGEIAYEEKSPKKQYVDLRTKSDGEKINLAIVRIKEEQDFVDFNLVKYIEVLNDVSLLDNEFYDKVKYGSSDKSMICLMKNGYSVELAALILTQPYSQYVHIDTKQDEVQIDRRILTVMEQNKINQILIFEIGYHLK